VATRLTTILVLVIVGATFIAGLIVGAQRDDASGPVDLIIVNGKVYGGGEEALQEALAVRGNQILRVGSNREMKRLRRAQTVVLDAHGGAVIPGLNESHVQLISGALSLEHLDLSAVVTPDDVVAELQGFAESDVSRPWLIGRNAPATLLEANGTHPRRLLDEANFDRPVLITSEDGEVAWANSKALQAAKITRRTKNPKHGLVVKDQRTGEPTGVLKHAAVDLVADAAPEPSASDKVAALRQAIAEAHKVGITSLQSVSASDEELRLLDEVRKQGDLTVRVSNAIAVSVSITEPQIDDLDRLRDEYPDDPALKLGGVEIVCPCPAPELTRSVALLDKHNWHVSVRTTTGAEVRAAVDAFEHSSAATPDSAKNRRYRIDDHLLGDGNARLLFASGWPSALVEPLDAIEDEVTKPGELRQAIDAYTSHAALASADDQRKGTLAPGMLADIVILSKDIFEDQNDPLRDAAVTVTIFDGKVVYQRPTVSSND
jgi:predicted amidohydrolase YtcJ